MSNIKSYDVTPSLINFCNFLDKPVKKITLLDLPSTYTYELMCNGVELASRLENKYQVFNFTEGSKNSTIDILKEVAINEINKKMTKEQNKNSLNFARMSKVTLKVHPNTPYKLFDDNLNKFMEDVYKFKIEGYCNQNENIIEYSEVLEINPNE
jgi:hypothetical protein